MPTLADFQHAARYGQIILSIHAEDRCDERGADERDVKAAILSAKSCVHEEGEKYRLEGGADRVGDALTLVACLIQPGLLVVTIF